MDKAAIKTFAIHSRRKLMEDVEYRMSLVGITKDGIQDSISDAEGIQTFDIGGVTHSIYDEDIKKRENLVKEVNNKGFENVMEEVAYTWFNRIIAIRYMEINDYLPTRTRVLSSETPGKTEPDIITEAFNIDLDYTDEDRQLIFKFKDENKLDELFRFLFIKQCNKLNDILPHLFEKTEDFMELLLNISFISVDGVIHNLVNTIPEDDFTNQIEIIGWIYQYYNTEIKNQTFSNLKKKIKVSKSTLPPATQIFTPKWIVKYMVENSLGRFWLKHYPSSDLKNNWEFFVDDPAQEENVLDVYWGSHIFSPENIKIIDPCMGSGHILVYVFDVLMQIYKSMGYSERDATVYILENNIYGVDIDKRAYQLSYFSIMMKAREYNRNIFKKNINPFLFSIEESNNISKDIYQFFDEENQSKLDYLLNIFYDAKIYGSLINVDKIDFSSLKKDIENMNYSNLNVINFKWDLKLIYALILQAEILTAEYDIVITNPPYMGKKSLSVDLKKFMDSRYPEFKGDLYSTFIKRCYDFVKDDGFFSMITLHTWMFINSFTKLRKFLLKYTTFINMLHTGAGTFEELKSFNALATSFVLQKKEYSNYNSCFIRLTEFLSENEKISNMSSKENKFIISQDLFNIIPNSPIVYWISDNVRNNFVDIPLLKDVCQLKQGLATTDNKRFLRNWYEIDFNKIGFGYTREEAKVSNFKWFPYNKGGNFRKWYGNNELVVNWENDGKEIKSVVKEKYKDRSYAQGFSDDEWEKLIEVWVVKNSDFYFRESITYSLFGFKNFNVRYSPQGSIFDVSGSSIFVKNKYLNYILAYLSSNIAFLYLSTLAPTVNFQVGDLSNIPLIIDDSKLDEINSIVERNICISKEDWDNFEESWDFRTHYFLRLKNNHNYLSDIFDEYEEFTNLNFNSIKNNEELLNKIFMDIYGLSDDVDFEVEDKNISIRLANYEEDIKTFISFAVGCMFGRYSLDEEGLQFAGGEFNINNYSKFIPDDDNIIPVLDTEYFNDDIVGRFVEFVKTCFGEETLEENLDFIAGALKKKGISSREIIRSYFLTDFFKDHVQTYKKCPIYWQFDSGKQNGFKCLVYMHRHEPGLVARVRTDYLHKTQKAIELNIARCDNIINNSNVASEKSKATKEKNKLIKQLEETREYDEALAYIANQNIEIDLDDGVKVNYAKFQNVEVSKEGQKTKKINLLKKI